MVNGVAPVQKAASMLAPAARSLSTTGRCPVRHAAYNGVACLCSDASIITVKPFSSRRRETRVELVFRASTRRTTSSVLSSRRESSNSVNEGSLAVSLRMALSKTFPLVAIFRSKKVDYLGVQKSRDVATPPRLHFTMKSRMKSSRGNKRLQTHPYLKGISILFVSSGPSFYYWTSSRSHARITNDTGGDDDVGWRFSICLVLS